MNPRRIAFDVLLRVEEGGAFANAALDAALRTEGRTDERDRALTTELVYGTLRRALALDVVVARHTSRLLEEVDLPVRVLLRLGAYQVLHLRVPDHAAVAETVEVAKEVTRSGAGFVNAVLRAMVKGGAGSGPASTPAEQLLESDGLPLWLYEEWSAHLEADEVVALARAINEPAPVTVRAASEAVRDEAVARIEGARPTERSRVGLHLGGGGLAESIEGWDALGLQSQDEAAQLVTTFAIASGAEPLTIERVLDPCAAPGGKTCHLAQALPGAKVVAADLHQRRALRITEEAARLGLADRVEAYPADGTRPLPFADEGGFDLVLLDAPCTGLGTLQRHPEIKLRRGPDDVRRLAELQTKLLENLCRYVRRGGRFVYAVCTSTEAEGPAQVRRFLEAHPEFKLEPVSDGFEGIVDEAGFFWTWPHRHRMDGFFAARLRRA